MSRSPRGGLVTSAIRLGSMEATAAAEREVRHEGDPGA